MMSFVCESGTICQQMPFELDVFLTTIYVYYFPIRKIDISLSVTLCSALVALARCCIANHDMLYQLRSMWILLIFRMWWKWQSGVVFKMFKYEIFLSILSSRYIDSLPRNCIINVLMNEELCTRNIECIGKYWHKNDWTVSRNLLYVTLLVRNFSYRIDPNCNEKNEFFTEKEPEKRKGEERRIWLSTS